ncbi:MAG: radical SAM family heme chaperone HemW [SAR324 cluster bacterium]|nr:radical SAM family heme chaperone HemW [SAR324 cluster bacterium]
MGDPIQSLYIHIPFCRRLCPFCAFAVRKERATLHAQYLEQLLLEMVRRIEQFSDQFRTLHSIYIGGGTPSCLSLEEVRLLLDRVKALFSCSQKTEISFEVNPEDAVENYIQGLAQLGITRISLGIQSFQEPVLRILNRNHTAIHVLEALDALETSSIANYNLDLMFGIPGQSMVLFQNDVKQLFHYHPSHISLYGLDIEPNTPFARQPKMVSGIMQSRDLSHAMYLWAVNYLQSREVSQYEVSNFAKKGSRSRSNLSVWSGKPYLGFGTGAHSYIPNQRWANHRSLRQYQAALDKPEWPVAFLENLSPIQQANEKLMLGLRQVSGFSINCWQEKFDLDWPAKNQERVEQFCSQGYMDWNPPVVSLLPRGMLLADEITEQLMLS